jgi:hypothetical protein
VGPALFTELAKAPPSRLEAELRFLQEARTRYLLPRTDRIRIEVHKEGEATLDDVCLRSHESKRILTASPEEFVWDAERRQGLEARARFLLQERGMRRALRAENSRSELTQQMRAWYAVPLDAVRRMAEHALFQNGLITAVPAERLRTVWAWASYQAARTYLVHRDGRALDSNDLHDQEHYVAAAYADYFVTSDGTFRKIVNECPSPKPRLLHLAELEALVMKRFGD